MSSPPPRPRADAPPPPEPYDAEPYDREAYQQMYEHQMHPWPQQSYAESYGGPDASPAQPDAPYYETYAYDPYAEPPQRPLPQPVPVDPALVDPAPVDPGPEPGPGYTLPAVPESSWALDTRRGRLLGRGVLLFLLLVQAGLSLRLGGTAFQDEALYVASGHYELANLLHGTPLPADFAGYFSGHPKLYPVLAAVVDSRFGLDGVRAVGLLFMLGTTGLLYATTRRLFNLRAALGAAALFSVTEPTTVLGYFATYDAPAVFLLALAMYAVVRTDRMNALAVLLAAPPAALAVGVKYASGLYLPTLVVLAVVTAHRHRGPRALLRGLVLGTGTAALLGVGYRLSGPLGGISSTTTGRAHGTDSALTLFHDSAQWGGLLFVTALGGSVAYALRGRMGEMPWIAGSTPGRWRRTALGLLLTGTALLAPAYQAHLQTEVSLFKHVGFGLLFAAPMAGLGTARLVGPHFRHPQLGIMLYVLALVFGMVQARQIHSFFPDSSRLTAYLRTVVDRKGTYLATEQEVPAYYLRDVTGWRQWQNAYYMDYTAEDGRRYAGPDAFRQAVRDARFDVIVMRDGVVPDTYRAVEEGLKDNARYRLTAVLPYTASIGDGTYRVWVRR
ncbi:glycosyltransferase family 39 protein [Streptomyces sp. NPDC047000]|uniref:ArnT family glycosyltransferase n=1 Tax=Streptomyces sp. NPDC047000 TaxID=3155474 RepID=UPI00340A622C